MHTFNRKTMYVRGNRDNRCGDETCCGSVDNAHIALCDLDNYYYPLTVVLVNASRCLHCYVVVVVVDSYCYIIGTRCSANNDTKRVTPQFYGQ